MLAWLTLPFYDFCGFRSVAVNSVYKLQFFTFISYKNALYKFTVIIYLTAYDLEMTLSFAFDTSVEITGHFRLPIRV